MKHTCKICKKKVDTNSWCCIECNKDIFPFSSLSDICLASTVFENVNQKPILTKCPKNLKTLFTNLNDISSSAIDCKYYDIDDYNALKSNINSSLFLHLNISSLPFHIDELKPLINSLKYKPEVIGISESRLKTTQESITDIGLEGYSIEHTPTEASNGGALLYINSNNTYKKREDLQVYKPRQLESVFVEIIHPLEKNTLVGCLYRHPCMTINEFNNNYLNTLLERLSYENKNIILMGDFNINLLNYDCSPDISFFLDNMCSNALFPFITQPTRVTSRSKTIIDNIFINFDSQDIVSGNLTVSISDHMAQFIQIPNRKTPSFPKRIYKRCFKKFDNNNFKRDIEKVNWANLIKNNDNPNDSTTQLIQILESALDKHAPFKELTKKQLKTQNKPWLTKGILKSISIKDKLYKKYLKSKPGLSKDNTFEKFKMYRNKISNMLTIVKKSYYTQYFQSNLNDIKNTWKGIKELININSSKSRQKINLNIGGKLITDETDIGNEFNNFFSTIASKLSEKIVPSRNSHFDFLKSPNANSFFISPVSKEETESVILAMKDGKSNGSNSIPTNILKLIYKLILNLS